MGYTKTELQPKDKLPASLVNAMQDAIIENGWISLGEATFSDSLTYPASSTTMKNETISLPLNIDQELKDEYREFRYVIKKGATFTATCNDYSSTTTSYDTELHARVYLDNTATFEYVVLDVVDGYTRTITFDEDLIVMSPMAINRRHYGSYTTSGTGSATLTSLHPNIGKTDIYLKITAPGCSFAYSYTVELQGRK